MSEDEKQLVKKFKNLYIKDFNNEHITSNDRLSYIECALLSELIEKLEKELQQEKEKNKELLKEYNKKLNADWEDAISKDKIRGKLKYATKMRDFYTINEPGHVLIPIYNEVIKVCKELLEEN